MFSKWKERVGNVYFEQSLYEKKSKLVIFFLIIAYVKGKAPQKVNLNGSVTIEIGFSMQPIAWASGQLKFRTEFW